MSDMFPDDIFTQERKGITWEVTGIQTNGKRFKITTSSIRHAFGINLYRGSVWQRNIDGTRTLLQRVWN